MSWSTLIVSIVARRRSSVARGTAREVQPFEFWAWNPTAPALRWYRDVPRGGARMHGIVLDIDIKLRLIDS